MALVTEVNAAGSSCFVSAARAVHYMLCCQAQGDVLGMHLGVQRVHDGEDSEDSKGGGSMEGGSRAWRLLGVILLSWGPPGRLWRPWECPGMHACFTNGPCIDYAQTMGGIKAPRLM